MAQVSIDPRQAPRAAPTGAGAEFSVDQARRIVADLFDYKPLVYWTDFLITSAVLYGGLWIFLTAPDFSLLQLLAALVTGPAIFRVGTFIHEIVHMTGRELLGFRAAWNIVIGIPFLMISPMYANHLDHHSVARYGTPQDGEYVPLAAAPPSELVKYILQVPLLPIFAVLRFLVVTPLSYLIPPLRRWTLERASSYVSNPYYRRPVEERAESQAVWRLLEFACFVYVAIAAWAFVTGLLPWVILIELYLLMCYTLALNWLRNLGAHRYTNSGEPMTHGEQLADSINIVGQTWLTAIIFPVGLRYHALHHLFPAMPYHNLGEAHRRLSEQLPPDSVYHRVNFRNFAEAMGTLVRGSMASRDAGHVVTRWRSV